MKKTLIAFLTITILPILAYGYANESDCGDINNCPAGCGISFAGTAPECNICPVGTYSSQTDDLINPYYVCTSCGSLPEQNHTILSWYKSGAENQDECKYTFKCETGYIINPEYQQVLAITNNIISISDHYTEICSVKCGLNSYPNENKTACVCKTGTYVKGTTNDRETTDGTDCTPYIITIVTNNPDNPRSPSQFIDVLTILNQDTYLYYSKIDDIDSTITISHGDTIYSPSSLRKVLWGDKENVDKNHIDTGYKIKSWLDNNNPSQEFASATFSNITTNYSLRPIWEGKTFQITIQHTDGTSTTATECKYNETTPQCTINVPTLRGHTFLHWNCKTHDYKKNEISCTTPDIDPVNGTSPDLSNVSYGNDIVLTENWKRNEITLYYKDSLNPQLESTSKYNYGETTTTPGKPEDIWKDTYVQPNGQEFTGWQCTKVNEQKKPLMPDSDCGIISDDTDIKEMFDSGYILLTAQYGSVSITCNSGTYLPANSTKCTACPAGYYCEGGKKVTFSPTVHQAIKSCPAGSTSKANSDDITDCYITDQTEICESNNNDNCFQIPKGMEIKHNQIPEG